MPTKFSTTLFIIGAFACLGVNAQSLPLGKKGLEKERTKSYILSPDTLQKTDPMWWKRFGDATLDSLIHVAISENFSIEAAINRVENARHQWRITQAELYPTVGMNAGWTRQQTSGNITSEQPQTRTSNFSTTFNANWEIDLFGRLTRRIKAQREQFAATIEEENNLKLSIGAEVASAYINLREAQQELDVAKKNLQTQHMVLDITQARQNSGLVSKLDVAQAQSVYYGTQASMPQLEIQIEQYIATIATLIGSYPDAIRSQLRDHPKPLPTYMQPIENKLPNELLMQRPDVKQAQRQVNAQAALWGASKSDWLPQVSIMGSFGYEASKLKEIGHKQSMTYQITPSVSWTLFNGGQRIASTRLAQSQLDESIAQFNQTVLNALQEADQATHAYQGSIKQIVAMREVCYQAEETLRLSLDLYKQGLTPFQNVLDALRSLLSYQNQLTQAQGYSLLQLINLYKAFGGGW